MEKTRVASKDECERLAEEIRLSEERLRKIREDTERERESWCSGSTVRPEGGTIWESAKVGGVGCTRRVDKIVEQSMQSRKARRANSSLKSGSVKKEVAPILERKPWNAAKASSATAICKLNAKRPQKEPVVISLGELKGSSFIGLLRLNTKPERFGFSPSSKSLTPTKKDGTVSISGGAMHVHEKENFRANNVRVSYPASCTKSMKKSRAGARQSGAGPSMRNKAFPSKVSKSTRAPKCSVSSPLDSSHHKRVRRSSAKTLVPAKVPKSVRMPPRCRVSASRPSSRATTPTLSKSSSKISKSIRIPQPSAAAPHSDGNEVPAFPTPRQSTSAKKVSRVANSHSKPTRSLFASADSPIPMPKVYLTPRSANNAQRVSSDENASGGGTESSERVSTETETERQAVIHSSTRGGSRRKIEIVFAPKCADTNYGGRVTMGTSPVQESEYSNLAKGDKRDIETTVHTPPVETTTLLDQFEAEACPPHTGDDNFDLFATQVLHGTDIAAETQTRTSTNASVSGDVGTEAEPQQKRVVCYNCFRFIAADKVIRVEVNNFCGEKCVEDHLRTTKLRCCALVCRKIFVGIDGVQDETSKMWFCSREHFESSISVAS